MLAAGMSSTDSISPASQSSCPARTGANVTPQLPSTTDVTPCQHDDVASGSHAICASRCVCTSTKPGVTYAPSASMIAAAAVLDLADRDDAVAVDRDIGASPARSRCRRRPCRP